MDPAHGNILKVMTRSLEGNNLSRLTALKGLQNLQERDPFKILIATMLSARTRDENTTKVVKILFDKYRDINEFSKASLEEIREIIHSIGFYNVKALRIKQVVQILLDRYDGMVPSNFDELISLPGVGRKTANCVLVYAFELPAIPVDTHVHRISNRLGIVNTSRPEETESELQKIFDKKIWTNVNDTFVTYGQNICLPINPKCTICQLKSRCKYFRNNN
ncbi:MAG TPA: endonuclease III [Nitrososphaeraceae archaeon]|jgi:endonuclease-3